MARMIHRTALGALVAALLLAAPAFAGDSSIEGYGGPGGNVQDVLGNDQERSGQDPVSGGEAEQLPVSDVTPTTTAADDSGKLPFTGLDVGILLAGGLMLVALGFGMRRVARNTSGG